MLLFDVCLSVTYIGNNSRTERPRKTKIGTQVGHVARDSDTTFKVKRSKVNLQGRGSIVADSHMLLTLINLVIFMAPTAIGSKACWAHARVCSALTYSAPQCPGVMPGFTGEWHTGPLNGLCLQG